jgi:hypothetical protein
LQGQSGCMLCFDFNNIHHQDASHDGCPEAHLPCPAASAALPCSGWTRVCNRLPLGIRPAALLYSSGAGSSDAISPSNLPSA